MVQFLPRDKYFGVSMNQKFMTNLLKDFRKFALDKTNVKRDSLDYLSKNMTPYILEERKLNVTQMDVFSRLMLDRIIYFSGEVTPEVCDMVNAQLLYLNNSDGDNGRDIQLFINSPGGSVVDGLSVVDTMNFIDCDVSTTCMGMAASMGSVLLSNGTIGKRYVLPHSRVMIHQVSSSMRGTVSDMEIEFAETQRCKKDVYNVLAQNTGHTYEEMEKLCDRNNWFIGSEAVDELHIADKVIECNK